ncbi:MAG: Ppx/GppA phosphatase family protein [Sphingomonadaceae bacterium]
MARQTFGALDLGTNNCRLLIARPIGDSGEFQVIDAFSRIVRLGEGLLQSGRLSDAAMDRAIAALSACADKLARRGVTQVRSVATEACRRAANGADFVRRVYAETGLALDVITPAEEARLAVLGCQTLIDRKARRTLVFDIGGGSTEVVLLERVNGRGGHAPGFRMGAWVSVPWGVVSLGETEASDAGCPSARLEAYQRMKARVAAHLKPLVPLMRDDVQLLGASGTVTTLASLNMGLAQYDRRRVDGAFVSTGELVALSHDLAVKSPTERAAVPGIGPDRADLVVAGAAILEALIELGTCAKLRVADRGIREGILRSMMARAEQTGRA